MLTGWNPKPVLNYFLTIRFAFTSPYETYIQQLIKTQDQSIAYIGNRPHDSTII